MKWNKFIVETPESTGRVPIMQLDTSRRTSTSKGKPFALKSCDKIKLNSSAMNNKDGSMADQENINDSTIKKMLSKISLRSERTQGLKIKGQTSKEIISSRIVEPEEILQLVDTFAKEFEKFLKTFFQTYHSQRIKKIHQEALKNKLTENIEFTLNKYFQGSALSIFKPHSPDRIGSTQNKKTSRALQFKNEKINEKNGFQDAHTSVNEMQKILDNQKKEQRFSRTSLRTKPKRDRSVDSSVEEIIERSFNDSHRNSRSRLKAKQALYQFNKVLNHNNV